MAQKKLLSIIRKPPHIILKMKLEIMSPFIISKYLNSNDINNYVKQETNVNDFKGSIIVLLIVII